MPSENDTIAAVSTPIGESAIAVIRLSGPHTEHIIKSIFEVKSVNIEPRKQNIGWISDPVTGKRTDKVVVFTAKAPKSFTGEDTAEIQCHGGLYIVGRIFEILLKQGAREAQKGEFMKRAFLNGKVDLVQAEGIIDAIRSKTEISLNAANERIEGKLSVKIRGIRTRMIDLLAGLEASIDFPEDVESPDSGSIIRSIQSISEELERMIGSADKGIAINSGINVAIIGRTNVGKSSVLNMILERERAIVTEFPGTTTDTIEETMVIKGLPFRFIDTAGIRSAGGRIEEIGIRKTMEAIEKANIVIFVADASLQINGEDLAIIEQVGNKPILFLRNKIDKGIAWEAPGRGAHENIADTSALKGTGTEQIENILVDLAKQGIEGEATPLIANIRQKNCISKAKEALEEAKSSILASFTPDIYSIDIKEAVRILSEMTGEEISLEIIDSIFSRFCVGK